MYIFTLSDDSGKLTNLAKIETQGNWKLKLRNLIIQ